MNKSKQDSLAEKRESYFAAKHIKTLVVREATAEEKARLGACLNDPYCHDTTEA